MDYTSLKALLELSVRYNCSIFNLIGFTGSVKQNKTQNKSLKNRNEPHPSFINRDQEVSYWLHPDGVCHVDLLSV